MKSWKRVSLILCVFGMLKEFRPSDPFMYQYLSGPWHNFTEAEINQQIYPVATYGYLSQLVLVFLVTDLLRYKPIIILEGLAGVASWTLLIVGQSVVSMQVMNFLWGTFSATEVAYYTYIYAQVESEHYQKVTSHTRAAILFGRFVSGLVSQLLVSTETLDYYQLNFITVGSISLATIWAFFLPPAKRSIYFHRKEDNEDSIVKSSVETLDITNSMTELDTTMSSKAKLDPEMATKPERSNNRYVQAYKYLWRDFTAAYSNLYVVKWSLWWAIASCGGLQLGMFSQALWDKIAQENPNASGELPAMYNGAVESLLNIVAAAAAFGTGWLRLNWQVLGDAALAASAILIGAITLLAAYADSIYVAYVYYIVFGVMFATMLTIVIGEVAKHINEDSYGLIFGFNTFLSLVLQTIFTTIVASDAGLALPIRTQFIVYGGYFVVFGATFAALALVALCQGKHRNKVLWLPKT